MVGISHTKYTKLMNWKCWFQTLRNLSIKNDIDFNNSNSTTWWDYYKSGKTPEEAIEEYMSKIKKD